MKYIVFIKTRFSIIFLLCFFLITGSFIAIGGPPYDTDDPVPVSLRSWELYMSSHSDYNKTMTQGTLPHFEVNYGVIKNVQLHLIVPLAFSSENGGKKTYGIGDIEAGAKYCFIQETKYLPQVGIFPLCEIPTGNASKELGNGKAQFLLPVWLQKSFGEKWQSYGGFGYGINTGKGSKNWRYLGWQVQYQIVKKISFGVELYNTTAGISEGKNDTRFNIGSVIDINEQNHLLFSAGRSFNNNTLFQCMLVICLLFPRRHWTFSSPY